tara:strand:- start:1687 stop:3039 length:1353 start_codon:yes stop_codon:yes gene_type:complete
MINPKVEFINHASVLITYGNVGLLSDPWYQGDAFHKGWNLLHEFDDNEINILLDRTSHIWISHEHPDHFSISFFKKFGKKIIDKEIEILFQETKDKRVEGFLKGNKFKVRILTKNIWTNIGDDFEVLNFKDGFYDSGLAINAGNQKFLNLNDCEVKTNARCKEVYDLVGTCDVLISQFSYAAWKGGRENLFWRQKAAKEKLDTLHLQVEYFKPKILIPFASYIYFSNEQNFYLNDCANSPQDVANYFKDFEDLNVKVMKPFETIDDFSQQNYNNEKSIQFWNEAINKSKKINKNNFKTVSLDDLNESFQHYKERVFSNNSKKIIKLLKTLSPIKVFQPLFIKLEDHQKVVRFNIFDKSISVIEEPSHVSMSSESLDFIMKNTFGFDTLTVNGCFEEEQNGGFSRMTKLLAIENLNNIGISVNLSLFYRFDIIFLFLGRLFALDKKINNET